MKKSIQEILGDQMPTDLSKPVVVTFEQLKDCDFTTPPEELKLHIDRENDTLEVRRQGNSLSITVITELEDIPVGVREFVFDAAVGGQFRPITEEPNALLTTESNLADGIAGIVAAADGGIQRVLTVSRDILTRTVEGMKFRRVKHFIRSVSPSPSVNLGTDAATHSMMIPAEWLLNETIEKFAMIRVDMFDLTELLEQSPERNAEVPRWLKRVAKVNNEAEIPASPELMRVIVRRINYARGPEYPDHKLNPLLDELFPIPSGDWNPLIGAPEPTPPEILTLQELADHVVERSEDVLELINLLCNPPSASDGIPTWVKIAITQGRRARFRDGVIRELIAASAKKHVPGFPIANLNKIFEQEVRRASAASSSASAEPEEM
jgi:hypothetical protein